MSDDPTKRGRSDRDRINVNEFYELRYWSERLDVSPRRLKEIVDDVGPMAGDVEKALRGEPTIGR